ncbi:COP9 signalosome complex subunit 6-like [Varroa jacobsoni]|uniref:COP9 signalosome complex subunit 6 n=1 Tax=Varroa destructor TaxID=109461 RepID=A0A7M7J103_VARDE|nr:COP9 signalosome complex subunit 6-like [Varroa destructor]XP_022689515.1 COP9 signalosome complex subunit 6-like [Varroa jacobsoni]
MEVEEAPNQVAAGGDRTAASAASSDAGEAASVMAGAAVQPSVNVQLHPLVIMNVAEHWTRIRAQNGGRAEQVVGALLGKQEGRALEVSNSFELVCEKDSDGMVTIKPEFLENQQKQFKQVFQDLELLGWYTTGGEPTPADVRVHRQLCEFNDGSVLLKLDPLLATRRSGQLPVSMFESVIDMVNQEPTMLFVPLPCSLVTEEAERIGLDNMARVSIAESGEGSLASQHLRTQHSAIKMLYERVKIIQAYVKAVERRELVPNWVILREVFNLCRQLPVVESPHFREEYFNQCNDVALQTFLGTLTKCCDTINVYLNRFNVLYERQSGSRRSKRMYF